MAGISLDLVTDTRDIQKGFKTVEGALEDVADALDDVAKEGDQATEKLERSFSELARETKKEARTMGREVAGSYDKMARDAGEATGQMKDDAFSNAKEVASSFDGSAESIVDGFQGAAAEMFSGFGPAGAAAGLAAAAGLGLITAELQKQQEEADEAAARVDQMVADMISAQTTYVTEIDRLNALEAFLGSAEDRKQAQELADQLGLPLIDVAQAMFDLGGKREIVEGKISELYNTQREALSLVQGDSVGIAIEQSRIRDVMQEQLDLVNRFDEDWKLASDLASIYFRTQEDINKELDDQKQGYKDNQKEVLNLSGLDATPKFDTSPWLQSVKKFREDAQAELNRLTGPTISIGRRIP